MKGLTELLASLLSPEEIFELEDEYAETFHGENDDASEEVIGDISAEEAEWADAQGDLGVSEFTNKSIDDIKKMLSLPEGDFPFFNRIISDLGALPSQIPGFEELNSNEGPEKEKAEALEAKNLRILSPRWHQYVGLAASVKRFFQGLNVILADGVGVGKTMQSFMMMAYLRHLVVTKAKAPPIGKLNISVIPCRSCADISSLL